MIPRDVFAETLLQFLAPIRPFLEDPTVSDIMINGPDQIFVERRGRLELTGQRFGKARHDSRRRDRVAARFHAAVLRREKGY